MIPRIPPPALALGALLSGCDAWTPDFLDEAERNCDDRAAFCQDADGDGAGTSASVYVGCDAPDGYVTDCSDCDDADPATTDCPDTGDTAPARAGEG